MLFRRADFEAPAFWGPLGPTEGDARCPYVSGAAARTFAQNAA